MLARLPQERYVRYPNHGRNFVRTHTALRDEWRHQFHRISHGQNLTTGACFEAGGLFVRRAYGNVVEQELKRAEALVHCDDGEGRVDGQTGVARHMGGDKSQEYQSTDVVVDVENTIAASPKR